MLGAKGNATEVAALRLRAAQHALDAGVATRATTLLGQVERALPGLGVVPDLLAAARRRAGDRPSVATGAAGAPRRSAPPPATRSRASCATAISRSRTAMARPRSRSTSARSSCARAIRSPPCR